MAHLPGEEGKEPGQGVLGGEGEVAALEEASVSQDIQAGHEALAWRGEEPGAKPPRVRPFRPSISLPGRAENGPPGARGQVGRAVV
jgi:hypothetical protein